MKTTLLLKMEDFDIFSAHSKCLHRLYFGIVFCAMYLCLSHPTDISLAKKNFLLLVNVVDGTRMVIQSLKHGI